jgi:hypothetical protein
MKRLLSAVVLMAMGSAQAAKLEKKAPDALAMAPKPLALAPVSSTSMEPITTPATETPTAHIRIAPSAMMLVGPTGSATGLGGVGSLGLFSSSRSDLGLDFGYFQLSESTTKLSIVPIQFSWVRRFTEGPVRPYIGLAVGATILSLTDSKNSETLIIPSLALRPGVEVSITRSLGLFLEARGGVLMTLPFFNPQLGVALSL